MFHLTTATAQLADPNAAWSGPCQPDRYHLTRAFPMRHDDNRVANQRTRIACPQAETEPGEPRVFYLTVRGSPLARVEASDAMLGQSDRRVLARAVP